MVFVHLPSRRRPNKPWAAATLAVVCILVFIWLHWTGDDQSRQAALLRWGTLSASAGDWRLFWFDGRLLSLVTALFIHASVLHLLGNCVFLLIFGVPGERALGAGRLLALFFIGGALANLATSMLMGAPGRIIVGASGGISALIGAYLVLFPRARLGIVVPLGVWLEFIRAPAALLIGLWAALQLIFTFVGPAFGVDAWWAHLTGFAVGVLMALLFRPAMSRQARGR